jgi:hypothetical protein
MRVTRKFLKLTSKTYPHGTESQLKSFLPNGYKEDIHGNYYLMIGDKPSTMFTCHLDTACSKQQKVNHVFHNNLVKTDGTSILGADDKAGMTVILYMIEKQIPGLYYFFIGEEVGCVGSGRLARTWVDTEFCEHITKCVSFDRRGTTSVITHQLYGRCCSDVFASDLSSKFNSVESSFKFRPDDTGIYTDSAKFISLIPECTNISVGYYSEHSTVESQDVVFLKKLCKAASEIDWESLAVVRDPLKFNDYYDEDDDDFDFPGSDDEDDFFEDDDFSSSNFTWVKHNGETKKMLISKKQIEQESSIISNWLVASDIYPNLKSVIWNGDSLYAKNKNNVVEHIGMRYDIMEYLVELKSIPATELMDVERYKEVSF